MKSVIALSLAAALFAVGMASADPVTVDGSAAGLGTYYVNDDHTVWEESNGLDGLQTEETVLEDGTVIPADSELSLA